MNQAHEECLELLKIVHRICSDRQLKYTITADTLIAYVYGLQFDESIPIVYIAMMYRDFLVLRNELLLLGESKTGYSVRDHFNTPQFDTFEMWFVKEPELVFTEERKQEGFYYGTRLVITPLFYAGDSEKEWDDAYRLFSDTINTLNARAVLKGKPLASYIRLTPKRRFSNHYIKQRGKYTIEKAIEEYGTKENGKYVIYPQIVDRNKKDPNTVPRMVGDASKYVTDDIWTNVAEISFCGTVCSAVSDPDRVLRCFPDYFVKEVVSKNKSQLALNGGKFLWRVQQIQVELLVEFDRICRKYDLKYNISFGTLLGAIRHKGFIPWDDDIDVTMPWQDFNRLDDAMRAELDHDKYYYRCPANEKNNHLIFKHLERRGTVYTKPGRDKLTTQIGVFIDIFPMYPSAPLWILDHVHAKICRHWRTALWATVGAQSEPDPKKRNYYQRISACGNQKCYERFCRAATFFRNQKYLKFWIAMDRNPYKVPLVKMSNYTDVIEVEFEGRRFYAPREYEAVLDYCFGRDWDKYPSTTGRLPLHNAIMEIGDLYQEKERD